MMETLGKLPVGEDTAGPDNLNHLNLQTSPSKEDGMVLPRFLKVWRGQESATVQKPQESHLGGIFQKLKATAVISKFS